jgi:hypothetical protein
VRDVVLAYDDMVKAATYAMRIHGLVCAAATSSNSEYSKSSQSLCKNERGSLKKTGMGIFVRSFPMQSFITDHSEYFFCGRGGTDVRHWCFRSTLACAPPTGTICCADGMACVGCMTLVRTRLHSTHASLTRVTSVVSEVTAPATAIVDGISAALDAAGVGDRGGERALAGMEVRLIESDRSASASKNSSSSASSSVVPTGSDVP